MGEVEEAPAIFTRKTERAIHGDIPVEDIPGVGEGIQCELLHSTVRRGRSIVPNSIVRSSSATVKKAREPSLGVRGAKISNLLPAGLRDLNT